MSAEQPHRGPLGTLEGVVWVPVLAAAGAALAWVWRSRWPPLPLVVASRGSLTRTVVGKTLMVRVRPPRVAAVAPSRAAPLTD